MANYIHVPDEAPTVPKIDVTVDDTDYRSGTLKLVKELRPSWKPSEVKVKVQLYSFKQIIVCVLSMTGFLYVYMFFLINFYKIFETGGS